ncbi:hypothetical protein AB7849_15510 [Rhodanobacter sp. 115]|uniref:hypothetical protein n=1 Tax=Rhodanobacter sp. FW021-MT20 TaxID=1162282 RepID=UPI0034E50621
MDYNWEDFKRDFLIGARRAPRDFFAPVVILYRWVKKHANAAAERNIREAREQHASR